MPGQFARDAPYGAILTATQATRKKHAPAFGFPFQHAWPSGLRLSARFGLRPRFQVLVVLGIGRLWQGVFWAIFLFFRFRPLAWLAGAGLPMFGRGARSGSIAAVLRVWGELRGRRPSRRPF